MKSLFTIIVIGVLIGISGCAYLRFGSAREKRCITGYEYYLEYNKIGSEKSEDACLKIAGKVMQSPEFLDFDDVYSVFLEKTMFTGCIDGARGDKKSYIGLYTSPSGSNENCAGFGPK